MSRRLQRARHAQRVVAGFVLALFALGWLLDRAHGVLEPHRYCAEHQRVEHADVHELAVSDAQREHGPALAAPEPATPAHEACCLQLARGGDPVAVPQARVSAFAPAPCVPVLAPAWGTSPRGAVPLVLFAPKHSPPAS